jgi:hypothetical protein
VASYSYGALTIRVTADTKQLSVDISQAATAAGTDAAGKVGSAMTNGLRAAGGLAKSLGTSVATGLTVATGAATAFGVESFKTAARVGEMDASLRALAKANGLSYDTMQQTVAAIRKQGIEAGVAQNLVAQFARNNLDLAKSTDLAKVAQDAAVISGRNSTEVLADLTHGITTQNSQVLRNAGLNVQAGQAIDQYAKSVGKSVKDLTDAERSQAVLNAVLESGKTVAGAYAEAMTEPGKVLRSFKRVTDDIKLSVGQGLVQAFGPLILQAYDLAKAFSAAVGPGGALEPIFAAIGVAVGKLIAPLTTIIERWAAWLAALKPEQLQGIVKIIERFGPAFLAGAAGLAALVAPQLLGSIPVLGGVLTNLTGPLNMVVGGMVKMGGSALAAIPGLGSMGSAAGLLPAAMNPVGAAVVGVVAAIAALMVASKDFREGVIAMGQAIWTGLKPALSSVWELVKTFGAALWEIVKAIGDALGPALKNLAPLLEQIAALFGANLAGGADGASSSLGAIVPVITGVIKVIGFLLDITTKALVPLFEVQIKMAAMASAALQVINPLKLLGQAIEWLIGIAQKLWHWITGNSPGLIPAFHELGGVAGQVAGAMAGVVAAGFGKAVSAVQSATSSMVDTARGAFSRMATDAQAAGSSMVEGLKAGLSAAKSLGGWIGSNVTGPVVGFIKSGFGVFSPSTITITVGADVVEGLKRGLEAARQMGGWIQANMTGPVLDKIRSGLDAAAMTPIGQQMISGLQQGLSVAGQMGGWLQSNVAGPILGGLKSAFGIGSPSWITRGYGEDLVEGLEEGLAEADRLTLPSVPGLGGGGLGDFGNLAGLGAGAGAVINVYPSAGMDERQLAALVNRELAWATAGGVA